MSINLPGPDSRIKERIKERKRNVDKFGLGVQFFLGELKETLPIFCSKNENRGK